MSRPHSAKSRQNSPRHVRYGWAPDDSRIMDDTTCTSGKSVPGGYVSNWLWRIQEQMHMHTNENKKFMAFLLEHVKSEREGASAAQQQQHSVVLKSITRENRAVLAHVDSVVANMESKIMNAIDEREKAMTDQLNWIYNAITDKMTQALNSNEHAVNDYIHETKEAITYHIDSVLHTKESSLIFGLNEKEKQISSQLNTVEANILHELKRLKSIEVVAGTENALEQNKVNPADATKLNPTKDTGSRLDALDQVVDDALDNIWGGLPGGSPTGEAQASKESTVVAPDTTASQTETKATNMQRQETEQYDMDEFEADNESQNEGHLSVSGGSMGHQDFHSDGGSGISGGSWG